MNYNPTTHDHVQIIITPSKQRHILTESRKLSTSGYSRARFLRNRLDDGWASISGNIIYRKVVQTILNSEPTIAVGSNFHWALSSVKAVLLKALKHSIHSTICSCQLDKTSKESKQKGCFSLVLSKNEVKP